MRYEVRDRDGRVLGRSEGRAEGTRMVFALAMTAPGHEDDVFLVSLAADGREVMREDVFDIEPDAMKQ
jgi:hypothetical protein